MVLVPGFEFLQYVSGGAQPSDFTDGLLNFESSIVVAGRAFKNCRLANMMNMVFFSASNFIVSISP